MLSDDAAKAQLKNDSLVVCLSVETTVVKEKYVFKLRALGRFACKNNNTLR